MVAPGDLNWALCTPNLKRWVDCSNFAGKPASVELEGGTSEAAPLTAGVAALVIQAYQDSHHGHRPSPAVVKRIIVSTAQDISAPGEQQGAGLIDAYQAVLAARSFTGTSQSKQGHAVLDSATQLNGAGQPASSQHFSETLTNDGTGSVTVHLSSRTLSNYSAVASRELHLAVASGFESEQTFHVASGQARLNVSIALKGGVNLSLIAPNGDLAEFNLPQGNGNFGNAQVANPAAGTWTALIEAFPDTNASTLNAAFLAETATWNPFGTLSTHTVSLAAGASGNFSLDVSTPAQPGDQAGSIVLTSSAGSPAFAKVSTIPVILRSFVPTPAPVSTFSGVLTGGNGRGANTGQAAYYQLNVPSSGTPVLNATVSTGNAGNTLFAELVNPEGQAVSTANNGLLATTAGGFTELVPETGAQLHVLAPDPGVWTLVVDFYNTVSGTAAEQPFTVTMNDTPVNASQTGLPTSTSTVLDNGVAQTVDVTVTNDGSVPEEYFTDARLNQTQTISLASQIGTNELELPNLAGEVPTYLVPSHSTNLTATVTAKDPQFFDLAYPFGDPDLISSTGKTSTKSFTASLISDGDWTVTPFLKGPDGAKGAKAITARVAVTAKTLKIDRTFSSPTGDLWSGSTNINAGFTPYVVLPGQTVTIPVTITPNGSTGSVVSGTLFLSDSSFNSGLVTNNGLFGTFPTASDVAAFSYTYKIG